MTAAHRHTWTLGEADATVGSAAARRVTVRCSDCGEEITRITARTDDEIRAELDAANAEAAGA